MALITAKGKRANCKYLEQYSMITGNTYN